MEQNKFIRDLVCLSDEELKANFQKGDFATGIYDRKTVEDCCLLTDTEFSQKFDIKDQNVCYYLAHREQLNTRIAHILYGQVFKRIQTAKGIKHKLIKTRKSLDSLNFLTLALLYTDNFTKYAAYDVINYPATAENNIKDIDLIRMFNNNATPSWTTEQMVANWFVERLRLYGSDIAGALSAKTRIVNKANQKTK
ncbi:MAG: hypothetical protein MJ158_03255 [Alphaproteobacteria bacterium]|nr:hypothetical protein [Alphaproteobacteria bacterium]